MKNYSYILFLLIIFIISCKPTKEPSIINQSLKENYRNILRIHQSDKVTSIFPSNHLDNDEKAISQQVFESLFKYNPKTLELEKCLLESYSIDNSGTVYTFKIKKNILFHETTYFKTKSDRILNSDHVLYCLNILCHSNHEFSKLIKKETLSTDSSKYISGLRKINSTTFSISLKQPYQNFLHLLAQAESAIYPQEMVSFSYDKIISKSIGTGPFKIASIYNQKITLKRNEEYHIRDQNGTSIPYLEQIQFIAEPNIDSALALFEKGKIDLIKHLENDVLFNLQYLKHLGKIHIDIKHQPMASIDFLGFSKNNSLSANIDLRKSLSLALNKMNLLEQALDGEADHPSNYGFTPELLHTHNYKTDGMSKHVSNIDSAKKYLDTVSFPSNIRNLSLTYDKADIRHIKIASAISRQLKQHLNIDLLIKPVSIDSLNQKIKNKQYQLVLKTYDYSIPEPIDFMLYLYKNDLINNTSKPHLDLAKHTISYKESLKNCLAAEQMITEQCNIIPLWSNEYYEIVQPDIENLIFNGIKYYDFRTTFIREIEQITPKN